MRTIAEGAGDELLVGTTRNALLRGTLGGGFSAIVQVWGRGGGLGVKGRRGGDLWGDGAVASVRRVTRMRFGVWPLTPRAASSSPAATTGSSACGTGRSTRWSGAWPWRYGVRVLGGGTGGPEPEILTPSPSSPPPPQDTGLCADFHPGGQVVVVGLLTGR